MNLGWQLSPDGQGLEIDLTYYTTEKRVVVDRITIPLSVFQKDINPVQVQPEPPIQDTALGDGVQHEIPTSGSGDVEPTL